MGHILQSDIQFLPGLGPIRANLIKNELNIFTFQDLLYYFPYKYIDRTKIYAINELTSNLQHVQIKGKIVDMETVGQQNKKRLVVSFTDDTAKIYLVWFKGINWMKKKLKINHNYLVFGKPTLFNQEINVVHPEIELLTDSKSIKTLRIQPYYRTTEKLKKHYLNSKAISKLQQKLLEKTENKILETLPSYLIKKQNLLPLHIALQQIHFPENSQDLKLAEYRLKFDELFYIQLNILKLKHRRKNVYQGFVFSKVGTHFNNFYHNHLPFKLTLAQKKVIKEIRKDTNSGKQMNRLLQGDVGSGKTIVALLTILLALDNGYQACLMAPTEILATQHYENFVRYFKKMSISISLLKRTTTTKERNTIHAELSSGFLNILIGTHALIEDKVKFNNLGLAIIDEQHRFGVAQRAKLWKKKTLLPHILVMTATPIPRTLAMTFYGDLDVSIINELPPGRKPIKTIHVFDNKKSKMYNFLAKKISQGQQVYIVYPLIKESETMDYKNLEQGYKDICKIFPPPKYCVSMLHGKLLAAEKDKELEKFLFKKSQILVSTTVIEVGVDIPNATIMVIESAERFGLAQLHQLRGRVGRDTTQSYCILISSYKLSKDSVNRLNAMVSTNDGFEIAEIDLKLRGPGNIEGIQQSGIPLNLRIASLSKDEQLIKYTRNIADLILSEDPELKFVKNKILISQLNKKKSDVMNWSVIS